jgi:hypothetical protein
MNTPADVRSRQAERDPAVLFQPQDSENSTILHLLASLPSPDVPATEKKRLETYQAAVRMTNMYWDVCKSTADERHSPWSLLAKLSFMSWCSIAVPDLIDWSNSAGKTALHMACQSGNTELVRVSKDRTIVMAASVF